LGFDPDGAYCLRHTVLSRKNSMQLESILVPTDFSFHASRAFDWAIDLAQRFDAQIVLVHIHQLPWLGVGIGVTLPLEYFGDLRAQAKERLGQWAERARALGIQVAILELESGDPAHAICEIAEQQQVDLIVMGTHGWTGLERLLLGSVAERTVRRAPCSVLTLRDPAHA
jgi:universal stress protein A